MKCSDFERAWEDWLSGSPPAGFEQHLRDCVRCRELAAELARTPAWLSSLREEPFEPGPAFWTRLRARLEERERGGELWSALAWAAGRAAMVLAVLVILLAVGMLQTATEPPVADFDGPQVYLTDTPGSVPVGTAQLDRDQVLLTLVAQGEASR